MNMDELPCKTEPIDQYCYEMPELSIINNEDFIEDNDKEQPAEQALASKMPNGDPISLMLWGVDE